MQLSHAKATAETTKVKAVGYNVGYIDHCAETVYSNETDCADLPKVL